MRYRKRRAEIMDEPGLDEAAHEQALRALGRIHAVSGSIAFLFRAIERFARSEGRPVRVLDLATGGGDVALGLADSARSRGLEITVDGADVSPTAIAYARRNAAQQRLDSQFFRLDCLTGPIPATYDILLSTLFLHHLSESDAGRFMNKMAEATRSLVLIDDLIRAPFGYAIAWVGCQLLTRSRVVHHDGPVSVRSAFTVNEVRRLAETNGLSGAETRTHWPKRVLLTWRRR